MSQDSPKFQLSNWEIVSVNPIDKTWSWKDYFCFWANTTQSLIAFSLIASLYILYDLNIIIVFSGSIFAGLLVYFFSNLIGKPSSKHGIPFVVFLRTSIGLNGARYFGILRGFVGIFFFGVQTYFISKSIGYLIRISLFSVASSFLELEYLLLFLMGLNLIDFTSLFLAIVFQIYLFSKSHKFNQFFINFSAIVVYLGMLTFFCVIILYEYEYVTQALKELIVYENFFNQENLNPIISVAATIFAYFSITLINYGDFARYVKNQEELKKGNFSIILNLIIFSFFAVFIVLGSDVILNNNLENMERILTNPTDIIAKFDNILITIIVLFFILFASSSTNLIANYIPTQNSLLNFVPSKLNLKNVGIIIALFGLVIGVLWLTLLSQVGALSFIDTFASFFGPFFGIIVTDYYLIKKRNLINKDIFSSNENGAYFYSNGWHYKAIYSLVIGFVFAASTIWNENLMHLQSYSWIIGMFISSLTYYLLASR